MKVGERRTDGASTSGRKKGNQPPDRPLARYAVRCRGIENGLVGGTKERRTYYSLNLPARARSGCSLPPSLPRSHGMQADRLQLCQKSSLICAQFKLRRSPLCVDLFEIDCGPLRTNSTSYFFFICGKAEIGKSIL